MNTSRLTCLVVVAAGLASGTAAAQSPADYERPNEIPPAPPPATMYLRASVLYGPIELDFDEFDDYWFVFPDDLEYDVDFDSDTSFSFALGWDNVEIELLHFDTDDVDDADNNQFEVAFATADLDVTAVMVNGTWQYPLQERLNLYFGGGIGIGFYDYEVFQRDLMNTESFRGDEDDIGLGLQLMGGLTIELDPRFDLYAGGRAFWLVGEDITIENLALELGLRFYF